MLQVGLADLYVKAEDIVELDLERVDAGALALALLDLGDVVFAVAADVAEFVELRIESALDDSAIVEGDGRLGEDAALDALAYVGEFVEQIDEGGEARGREVGKCAAHGGEFGERCGEGEDVARVRGLKGDAAEQTLDVENAIESAAQLLAMNDAGEGGGDGVEALIDLGDIDRGAQHPGAQQALAHRGEGVVEGAEEGYGVSGAGKEGLDQLKVADGYGVEDEAVLALVVADAVDVAERAALRLADVVEDGSGGAGGGVVVGEAEAFQRKDSEMIFNQGNGVVGGEDPVVKRSLAPAREGRKLGGGQTRRGRGGVRRGSYTHIC